MRPWTIISHYLLPTALIGVLAACGGGSSAGGGSVLPPDSVPVTTFNSISPADSPLKQYQIYTFSASGTDATIGRRVTTFLWNFGDGTATVSRPATANACTVTHAFQSSGAFTGTVTCLDDQNLVGKAASFPVTVAAAASPVTVGFTSPASDTKVPLAVQTGLAVTTSFTVSAVTTTNGATLGAGNLIFSAGDGAAYAPVVGTIVANGGGSFTIPVTYQAAATLGARTITPTLSATDSMGNTSALVQGPAVTLTTTGQNTIPTLLITTPANPSTDGYTSKPVDLAFSISDADGDKVSYKVDWGDGSEPTKNDTGSSDTTTPVAIALTHPYPDSFASGSNANPHVATATITIDDGRTPTASLPSKSCTYKIAFNRYPTATIITPQASLVLPSAAALPSSAATGLVNPPGPNDPSLVVIPVGGKLNFTGTGTLPGSGDAGLTYAWTFQNGALADPSKAGTASPGDVFFNGTNGVITPCLVTLTVKDAFGRASSAGPLASTKTYQKWVIVDGTHSQTFNMSFLYHQRSGTAAPDTFTLAQKAVNGNGAEVSIFQDGMNNTYAVTSGSGATALIPVRSDVPFWLGIPGSVGGATGEANGYMFRVPNQKDLDPDLELSGTGHPRTLALAEGTAFAFQSDSYPWNPQLQMVTASGFGTEQMSAETRSFQGSLDLYNNYCDLTGPRVYTPNVRWLDRLSVPTTDSLPVLNFSGAFPAVSNILHGFSGILGYQAIPEWFVFLKGMETRDYNTQAPSGPLGSFRTIGSPANMGFVVDSTYNNTSQSSEHWSVSALQAYRAPAGTRTPYDFDIMKSVAGGSTLMADNPNVGVLGLPDASLGLNPTRMDPDGLAFMSGLVNTAPSGPLAGGLASIAIPYDANSTDWTPNQSLAYSPFQSNSSFSYAEYLWTSAWARPLVLNRTNLNWADTRGFDASLIQTVAAAPDECTNSSATRSLTFPYFYYSNPTTPWPSVSNVSPNQSGYDLNVVNGGVFNATSPVSEGGLAGTSTGVGRFFWTAFNTHYNANGGGLISRTWLADGTTHPRQIPTTFDGTTSDATTAWGFLPPQDANIDKRPRGADGLPISQTQTGGYRLVWFNPTRDSLGDPVSPDFWAVQLVTSAGSQVFLLPASYPRATAQALTDPLVTDARTFLPSGQTSYQPGDLAGPGYCWFDVPPELRPDTNTTATVTVFALKSILKNHAVPGARKINRSEWVAAVKTVTASISAKPDGVDVSFAHKIPFAYPWDIVVVNGPVTTVTPTP